MLRDDIRKILSEKCNFDPKKPLIAAVSGGPDSLCMLHLLVNLELKPIVAHLDHSLRESSGAQADWVKKFAQGQGLQAVIGKADVQSFAEQEKLSLEEAARIKRYQFLFKVAQEFEAQAVLVGHHADDQVETVLMHFLRGAGTSGLKGMTWCEVFPQWSDRIPLWRPLLGIWQFEILAYCKENDLEPLVDESNTDPAFFRNRLRLQLLPELATYNPQIKAVIWRMGEVMREDDLLLSELTDSAWHACILDLKDEWVTLKREVFSSYPVGLKRRLIRRAISHLHPQLRDITLEIIDRSLDCIESSTLPRRIDLAAGLDLMITEHEVDVINRHVEKPVIGFPQVDGTEIKLLIPGETLSLSNNWYIEAQIIHHDEFVNISEDIKLNPENAFMRLDVLNFPLTVRGRKVGDRWQPFGMRGHSQKISDLFINEKVPEVARNNWPLVIDHEKIIWVTGIRPSEEHRLVGNEKKILWMKLYRK